MKKQTYLLIGILVVLLIIAYAILQKHGELSLDSSSMGLFTQTDSTNVNKIEINASNTTVILEKQNGEWHLIKPINYKANQSVIKDVIHQTKNLTIKSFVSNKKEKHALFNVDNSGAFVKIFENGLEKSAFIIGKKSPNNAESYARNANSDDVFLVEGADIFTYNKPIKEWRFNTIFFTQQQNISKIKYYYGDTTFTIAFKDSSWYVDDVIARQYVVTRIIEMLSNFTADDFVDTEIKFKPNAKIEINNTTLLFAYNKQDDKYMVKQSNLDQIFIIDSWKANQVLKRKKDVIEIARQ